MVRVDKISKVSTIFLAALIACAQSQSSGPDPTEPPDSSVPITTSSMATSVATTATEPATGSPPEAPEVLIATRHGILLGDEPYAAVGDEVTAVIDDLDGGIVYLAPNMPDHDVSQVWWVHSRSAEPALLVEFIQSEGVWGQLHQVVGINGYRSLLITRRSEAEGGEPEEYLEVHDLDVHAGFGDRVLQTGGIEWGAQSVSYGGDRLLITEVSHSCGDLYLVSLSGERLERQGLPNPPCEVHFEVPFLHGRLSPDGSLLAYVAQQFRFIESLGYPAVVRSDLVVSRLETGEEVLREELTDEPEEGILSMDFNGDWLVWVRTPSISPEEWPSTDTEVLGLRIDGSGRFAMGMPGVNSVWLPRAALQP